MNLESVLERFSIITNVDAEKSAKYVAICEESILEIRHHLKKDISEEENSRRLEVAAAALAIYKYNLYSASIISAQTFSAGELKIKSNADEAVKTSKKVWIEAKKSILDLLEDKNFIFERIAF